MSKSVQANKQKKATKIKRTKKGRNEMKKKQIKTKDILKHKLTL